MQSARAKLKIGLVLDDSLDTPDGVQQYVLTLGGWLASQGYDVHYLVGETTRADVANVHSLSRNMKVRFNGNRMSMPLPASRAKLRALLAHEKFDVLHVQMPYSPFLAGRIVTAAPDSTAVVGTFHVAPHSRMVHFANHALRVLTRRSLKRFDTIMSVSSVAQAFARKTFKVESSIVPNMVDLAPFRAAQPTLKYATQLNVVFLGRLVARKGCEHLLRAVTVMQEKQLVQQPYNVIICGKGPLDQELKAYGHQHELDSLVNFAGFVSEQEKPSYLAAADVVVFPSTGGESFGIVLVEAMAAARGAVLGGDNPGYASVMKSHPESLFNPADDTGFAEKISTFLNDAAARAQAQRWQQMEVMQYDAPIVGQRVVAQYRAALHKRSR